MPVLKTQGFQLAFAATFGATKNMTAVSNTSPAVATLEASHGVAPADILHILTSGWPRLDGRVARASAVATNDVSLEGINALSTANYPATEGVGTVREILTWTNVTQLLPDFSVSGGGFRFQEITESNDVRVKQTPTLAEASSLEFSFHYHPSLTWLQTIADLAAAGAPVPYRLSIGAARSYGSAYIGFNPEPSPQGGVFVGKLALSTVADSVNYAS